MKYNIEHLACLGHCSKSFPCTNGIGAISLSQLLRAHKVSMWQMTVGIVSSDDARICLFGPPFEIVVFCVFTVMIVLMPRVFDGLFREVDPGNTVSLSECGPAVKAATHTAV